MLQGSRSPHLPVWVLTRIDDEAVEHYRGVGCFTPAEDREPLAVVIVQRDDLSPDGDPGRIQRNPAQIRISGIRLDLDETRELIRLLNTAIRMINNTGQSDARPRSRGFSYNGGYGFAPVDRASRTHPERRTA